MSFRTGLDSQHQRVWYTCKSSPADYQLLRVLFAGELAGGRQGNYFCQLHRYTRHKDVKPAGLGDSPANYGTLGGFAR